MFGFLGEKLCLALQAWGLLCYSRRNVTERGDGRRNPLFLFLLLWGSCDMGGGAAPTSRRHKLLTHLPRNPRALLAMPPSRGIRKCSYCKEFGHNIRTCPVFPVRKYTGSW
eukprot:g35425.t1